MDAEKKLPSFNVEEDMLETLQLTLMLFMRQHVGGNIVIPRQHLNIMKNFTVDVKANDQMVQYRLIPLPQRGSSDPTNSTSTTSTADTTQESSNNDSNVNTV